jgi:D-serine deaminase-like pyridoxal phosphate-dependent protein
VSATAPPGSDSSDADLRRLDAATAGLDPPFAVIDVAALRANADDMVRRASGKPIRLASKSVRCRAVIEQVLRHGGFRGIMAFTLPEALWLAGCGTSGDILVAYPTVDRAALRQLAGDPAAAAIVTVMVDCEEHLDLIAAAVSAADGPAQVIRVCIDIDTAYHALGGRMRVGARRSPVRTPAQAAALARVAAGRPGLRLTGLMAYEAQIAGVGDDPGGRPAYGRAVRYLQRLSGRELAARRAQIAAAVRGVTPLEFVNGGGTGSIEKTTAEDAVTEIGAGSGLYQPTLFDAYRGFSGRPAALFALPVVRRPGPGVVTVLGGGYLASGPADAARLPVPHLPAGLSLDAREGAGEVQTPLLGAAADGLAIGGRVWFRHAKAGELCERFTHLHLVEGGRVTRTVPTYRGEGKSFA